jgi:hypothetical protein
MCILLFLNRYPYLTTSVRIYAKFLDFYFSPLRVLPFLFLDVFTDFFMCTSYIIEMGEAVANRFDPAIQNLTPAYLYMYRTKQSFRINLAFSCYIIFSRLNPVLRDGNRFKKRVFSSGGLVDLVTAVPFIVAVFIPNGRYVSFMIYSYFIFPHHFC